MQLDCVKKSITNTTLLAHNIIPSNTNKTYSVDKFEIPTQSKGNNIDLFQFTFRDFDLPDELSLSWWKDTYRIWFECGNKPPNSKQRNESNIAFKPCLGFSAFRSSILACNSPKHQTRTRSGCTITLPRVMTNCHPGKKGFDWNNKPFVATIAQKLKHY